MCKFFKLEEGSWRLEVISCLASKFLLCFIYFIFYVLNLEENIQSGKQEV